MNKDQKKRKHDKKIVPFEMNDEIFTDPDIDQLLKKSLIQEADELEAELNTDPKLTGVGASDDLLQSIVGKLKAQGIWEEEEDAAASARKTAAVETADGENRIQENETRENENREDGVGEGVRYEATERLEISDRRGAEVNQGETAAKMQMEHNAVQQTTDVKADAEYGTVQQATNMKVNAEKHEAVQHDMRVQTKDGEKKESHSTDVEISAELGVTYPNISGNSAVPGVKNIQDIYDMLPEEDRRAMQLGWEMEKKEQRKAVRRKRRRKVLRYGGTAVAGLAVVFGLGMTSEANRRLVQKAWDVMAMNFNFYVRTNYSGEDTLVRSKSREEVAAMEDISENLGVSAISFEMLPSGMEYDNYDIIADTMEAVMFYTYQDTIFSVTIINVNAEGSAYYVMDTRTELVENIVTEQDFEAKIWETNQELDEENRAYIAEINYEGSRYILNGILPLEEMEKIVKSAFIL